MQSRQKRAQRVLIPFDFNKGDGRVATYSPSGVLHSVEL